MTKDDDTLLMTMPWNTHQRRFVQLRDHVESYEDAHNVLRGKGWEFEELLPDGLGSIDKLRENSASTDGDGNPINFWDIDHHREEGFFPRMDSTWNPYRDLAQLLGTSDWEANALNPYWTPVLLAFLATSDVTRYTYGACLRLDALWIQHEVAKTIENTFCLDNRGRPT